MKEAFNNVWDMIKSGGHLFISIYNDQGIASKIWKKIKKTYVNYPFSRGAIIFFCGLWLRKYRIAWGTLRYGNPIKFLKNYGKNNRGMSAWHDVVDWTGGYPFEVAKPEEVFYFFKAKGFELERLKTCGGGIGCNEFVFFKK
jgi:2-polyprenyl-6-hydroxyphenyl methylase/3-demethylubiquinone-9 3-methyltransferase